TLDTLDPVAGDIEQADDTDVGPSILDITPAESETVEATPVPTDLPVSAVTETPHAGVATEEQFDWDAMLTHGRLIAVNTGTQTPAPRALANTPSSADRQNPVAGNSTAAAAPQSAL